jgi:hypothetical protein
MMQLTHRVCNEIFPDQKKPVGFYPVWSGPVKNKKYTPKKWTDWTDMNRTVKMNNFSFSIELPVLLLNLLKKRYSFYIFRGIKNKPLLEKQESNNVIRNLIRSGNI